MSTAQRRTLARGSPPAKFYCAHPSNHLAPHPRISPTASPYHHCERIKLLDQTMSHHETTESQSAGSTRSSRNAVKHGLTSSNFCLLADEDAQLFNDYRSSIEQALAPRNVIEAIHVARIVESTWMIFRASLMEAKAISVQMDTTK
ncbi:hypothetical protein WDZ92_20470, partial [Nostoc sp. NIES-2111]